MMKRDKSSSIWKGQDNATEIQRIQIKRMNNILILIVMISFMFAVAYMCIKFVNSNYQTQLDDLNAKKELLENCK